MSPLPLSVLVASLPRAGSSGALNSGSCSADAALGLWSRCDSQLLENAHSSDQLILLGCGDTLEGHGYSKLLWRRWKTLDQLRPGRCEGDRQGALRPPEACVELSTEASVWLSPS